MLILCQNVTGGLVVYPKVVENNLLAEFFFFFSVLCLAQSSCYNKDADQFYDSLSGLKGPPETKVSKGRKSDFEVGFGVANPHDLTLELVLDGDYGKRRLRYAT